MNNFKRRVGAIGYALFLGAVIVDTCASVLHGIAQGIGSLLGNLTTLGSAFWKGFSAGLATG